jgi:hypothetical protein
MQKATVVNKSSHNPGLALRGNYVRCQSFVTRSLCQERGWSGVQPGGLRSRSGWNEGHAEAQTGAAVIDLAPATRRRQTEDPWVMPAAASVSTS